MMHFFDCCITPTLMDAMPFDRTRQRTGSIGVHLKRFAFNRLQKKSDLK
jgi:hypothetical protein